MSPSTVITFYWVFRKESSKIQKDVFQQFKHKEIYKLQITWCKDKHFMEHVRLTISPSIFWTWLISNCPSAWNYSKNPVLRFARFLRRTPCYYFMLKRKKFSVLEIFVKLPMNSVTHRTLKRQECLNTCSSSNRISFYSMPTPKRGKKRELMYVCVVCCVVLLMMYKIR